MSQDATPARSVRLSKAHRDDIVNAVMSEWEAQNPKPATTDTLALARIVAPLIKETAAYKRTQRMLNANLAFDDWQHVSCEHRINVCVVDDDGATQTTLRIGLPVSVAQANGLVGTPKTKSYTTYEFSPCQVAKDDIVGEKPADLTSTRPEMLTLAAFTLVESSCATVQVNKNSPEMRARKELSRRRDEWESERKNLLSKTRDLLDQFNTTKQLRESWPDIVPYLPPHIADPKRAVKLPVLATSRLSERLGIKGKPDNG